MQTKSIANRIFNVGLCLLFVIFLFVPLLYLLWQSFGGIHQIFNVNAYKEIFKDSFIYRSLFNSFKVSLISSILTTILALICAYVVRLTKINDLLEKYIKRTILIPMFVPTITYGFLLMYVFGNQGILSQLIGKPLFTIYGFNGLLMGYIIYTLPSVFLIIYNAMYYLDLRLISISRLMQDKPTRRFYHTILHPLFSAIGAGFMLSFVLSFTDYGIPASIGGTYDVVSMTLYEKMLGTIPNIAEGAVVSILMLIPSVIGILLLSYLNSKTVKQNVSHHIAIEENKLLDRMLQVIATIIVTIIGLIFILMFIIPFTTAYPYDLSFTTKHIASLLSDEELLSVFINSFKVAILSAIIGTIIAVIAAILSTHAGFKFDKFFDTVAQITNAVPGMVLGLSYLLIFNFTSLKGSLIIIVISIVVHYFATPFIMAKNALEKMNHSLITTSALMHDNWWQTLTRVIIPNIKTTIVEIISYYFINAMVTLSGVIFLVTSTTMLASTKINVLQHFNKFNEIFILSILICITNVIAKLISDTVQHSIQKKEVSS